MAGNSRSGMALSEVKLYSLSASVSEVDIIEGPSGAQSGSIVFNTNAGMVAFNANGNYTRTTSQTMIKGTDHAFPVAKDTPYTFPYHGGDMYAASATASTDYQIVFYEAPYRG